MNDRTNDRHQIKGKNESSSRFVINLYYTFAVVMFADNEIYIEQVGDGLELIIEQTGNGNLVGQNTSTGSSASDMKNAVRRR